MTDTNDDLPAQDGELREGVAVEWNVGRDTVRGMFKGWTPDGAAKVRTNGKTILVKGNRLRVAAAIRRTDGDTP
jgi:hypothetical protein